MNKKYLCLIVDDDPWALLDLRKVIDASGLPFFVAGEARNADEALILIEEIKPHLVITDICMGGNSGLDLIEECRRKKYDTEFAILSGYSEFKYAQRAMESMVRYYLLKPINLLDIRRMLEKVIMSVDGECYFEHPDEYDVIDEIIEYLRKNLSESCSLSDIAAIFNFNKNHLSEMFKRKTGKTFVQYKNELRLGKAKKLLAETRESIAGVGHSCGFMDAAYFSAIFRQNTGLTPQQYRESIQKNGVTKNEDP